jgi:DNA-binding protein H-NS
MLMKIAKKHPKVKVSFGTHSKGKFVDDNNINFKGQEKDIDMLMKDIQNNHKNLVKMMEDNKLDVMDEYAKMYEDAVQKAREKQRLSDTHKREKEALAKKHARMKEQKELDEGMMDLDKARKLPDNIQKQIVDAKKEYDRTWDGVFVPMGKEGSSQRKEYERRGKLFKAASKKYKDLLKKHKVATFK